MAYYVGSRAFLRVGGIGFASGGAKVGPLRAEAKERRAFLYLTYPDSPQFKIGLETHILDITRPPRASTQTHPLPSAARPINFAALIGIGWLGGGYAQRSRKFDFFRISRASPRHDIPPVKKSG